MTFALERFSETGGTTSWAIRSQPRPLSTSAAFAYDPEVERTREKLIGVIKRLATTSVTWTERDPVRVDELSAETAIGFIYRLPSDRGFPKVAPDGEGGIMLVWDSREQKMLMTIDRTTLLLIQNPGQPDSHHFRPLRFDGETIPPIILERLPRR